MLVCPQCQFENPESNKFCQMCGTSLIERACSQCGASVAIAAETCPFCNAPIGITRWAIVTGDPQDALFLDAAERYRIVTALQPSSLGWEGQVLDLHPLRLADREVAKQLRLAKPYFDLPAFQHILPSLWDGWATGDLETLLLEDRSQFQALSTFLETTKEGVPLLQILHWFYEMLDLWETVQPWNMQQTLLELENLRLDEDQVFCVQRLYLDPATPPTLQQLGMVWQALLSRLTQTQSATLHLLLADVLSESIATVSELRSRLIDIAQDLQDAPTAPVLPDPILTAPSAKTYPMNSSPSDSSPSDSSPSDSSPSNSCQADYLATLAELEFDDDDSEDMATIVLPMQLFHLEDAGGTDIGRQRNHNEDYFSIVTQIEKQHLPSGKVLKARGVYILCDGMGGHDGGEVASQMAAETLRSYFHDYWSDCDHQNVPSKLPNAATIREGIQLANQALYDENQKDARSGSGRMGTTLVMLLVQETEAAIAHVGDSRLYRFTRKRGLEQLTIDHEVGQREILRGVEPDIAYGRPDAYQLTQALGPRDENFVNPDVQCFEVNEDAVFILASDGLTDNDLLETYCQSHVEPLIHSQTNLDQGVQKLIELANQHNGHDNITAIVIRAKVRPNLQHGR